MTTVLDLYRIQIEQSGSWSTITGSFTEARIVRALGDVGTLDATLADATLDPTTSAALRLGRLIRVQVKAGGDWETIFTGSVRPVDASHLPRDRHKIRITITATDQVAYLANLDAQEVPASLSDLRWWLDQAGVPFNINGATGPGSQPDPAALNPNAKMWDQVLIARDSARAFAWVDVFNRLQVHDADHVSNTVAATFTPSEYGDIDTGFAADQLINSVTVNYLRHDIGTDTSTEIPYGPYEDADSIDDFDRYSATFTLAGVEEDPDVIAAFASEVLARSSSATVRARSIRIPLRSTVDMSSAILELGDLVEIERPDEVVDTLRVIGIEHSIGATKWSVTYTLGAPLGLAVPTQKPSTGISVIPDGAVGTAQLAPGSVSSSKIADPDPGNLVIDPDYLDPLWDSWTLKSGDKASWTVTGDVLTGSGDAVTAQTIAQERKPAIRAKSGEEFTLAFESKASGLITDSAWVAIVQRDSGGSVVANLGQVNINSAAWESNKVTVIPGSVSPGDHLDLTINIGANNAGATLDVRALEWRRRLTGDEIADGAVDQDKVDFTVHDIGGVSVTTSASAPVSAVTGDVWIDTGNGNRLKTWNGSSWVDRLDAAVTAAASAASTADGKATAAQIAANAAITDTEVEYAVAASDVTPPASGWSTSTPSRTPGSYIWFRTKITYGSGSTSTTSPALLTGNTGAAGDDGRGISSTEIRYQEGTSGTTAPTGTWVASPPAVAAGNFLWTRTTITYTSGSPSVSYAVAKQGATGATGKGISSTVVNYAAGASGTTPPGSGWGSSVPATSPGDFLWTRTVITYTDSSTSTTYSIGKIGNTGAAGDQGVSVTAVTIYYYQSAVANPAPSKPTVATPASPWTTTEPAYVAGTNLWRTVKVTYSSGSPGYSYADVSKDSAYEAAKALRMRLTGYQSDFTTANGIITQVAPAAAVVASPDAPRGSALKKTGNGSGWWADANGFQAFDPEALYRITLKIRTVTNSTVGGKFYLGVEGFLADGVTYCNATGLNTFSSQHYLAAGLTRPDVAAGWTTVVRYFRGNSAGNAAGDATNPLNPYKLHKDVRYFRPLVITDYDAGDGEVEVGSIAIDVVSPEAFVALSTANGKNKVTYSTSDPGATANTEGDIWFKRSGEGLIIGQWRGKGGTSWQAVEMDGAVLANVDAGSITVGKLIGDQIAVGAVDTDHIAVNAVVAGKIAVGAVGAAELAAQLALLSEIQVGDHISINPDDGIIIDSPQGRTHLAADGSGSTFAGQGIFDQLQVSGSLAVHGVGSNIAGQIAINDGVSDPTLAPVVTPAWDRHVIGAGIARLGLCDTADGLYWVTTDHAGWTSGNIQFWKKSDLSAAGSINLPSGWVPLGGVTRAGNYFYVLAAQSTGGGSAYKKDDWRVFRFSTSAYLDQFSLNWTGSGGPNTITGAYYPAIGRDYYGDHLAVAFINTSGNLVWRTFDTDGTYVDSLTNATKTWAGHISGTILETDQYVSFYNDKTIQGFSSGVGSTLVRKPTVDFDVAIGTKASGLWYLPSYPYGGDARFHVLSSGVAGAGDQVVDHTDLRGEHDFAYTYYDSDSGGAGTAETKRSPIRRVTLPAFARWVVTAPVGPPDHGDPDDPNKIRIYVGASGGTLYRQGTELAEGVLSKSLDALDTTTAYVDSSGFASRPLAATGRIFSAAKDGSGNALIDLKGDGSGRVGPYAWDDDGLPMSTYGQIFKAGSTSVAFTSGEANINHGMGSTPTFAAAAIAAGSTFYVTFVKNVTSSQIQIVAKAINDGSAIANGTYLVRWFGVWG